MEKNWNVYYRPAYGTYYAATPDKSEPFSEAVLSGFTEWYATEQAERLNAMANSDAVHALQGCSACE